MAWFKVDDRLYSSLKVMRIPRRLRTAAIGLWTMAGSWSAHDLTDGYVPAFMVEEFGAELEHAEALVMTGLWERIEDDERVGFEFVKWSEYQPTKTDVEDQREKERERKRKQRRNSEGKFAGQGHVPPGQSRDTAGTSAGVPPMSQPGHAVPDPSRPGPARPQPTPNGVGDAPAKPKPKPANRKTRIPDDWAPNESHQAKASEIGIDLHSEAEKFRDHAIANGKTFADWSRGFHTWLNNALKFGPPPGGRPSERDKPRTFGQMKHDNNMALWAQVQAEEEGNEEWPRQLGA